MPHYQIKLTFDPHFLFSSLQGCSTNERPMGGNSDPFELAGSCWKFCQCSNGVAVEMPCAPGTAFNPAIGVCDHPWNVPGCGKFTVIDVALLKSVNILRSL